MWVAIGLVCLLSPVDGAQTGVFAPQGAYAGHWGVDLGTPVGTPVRAPLDGSVSFAGSVASMRTVTVQQGELKVSVSYLSTVQVSAGQRVNRGDILGTSGLAHGEPAVHLSVRLGGSYVDPGPFLRCSFRPISDALRLVPYPGGSAHRNTGRNVRPTAPRPPAHGRGRLPPARTGHGRVHAGGSSLAKSRPSRVGAGASVGHDPSRGRRRRLLRR